MSSRFYEGNNYNAQLTVKVSYKYFGFSSRFMSNSNRIPIQNARNPFVDKKVSIERLNLVLPCLKRPFVLQNPDLPSMEFITNKSLNVDTHISCKKVKYGEYEFMECKEGYILCYINGYLRKKEPQNAFYGLYYGDSHPL